MEVRNSACSALFRNLNVVWGRGCLMVRSRPRGRRVPGSKPVSTEEQPCTLNTSGPNVLPLVRCGSLERGCQLRCRPRHLTTFQNDEIRPKIALVFLQNWT
ncbi:hypothetical protein AVEN_192093-1 [Araneus ventricosus]|uniref:Uncharacterized protein n=1 Tax=Araneus ventricosus TaxID=182803 RepID=A0A4Y2B7A9_ARAVE|nr:hypothetical protein AVEN_192093-1 [Araneus ventricosus]